ncbi:MAG: MFS transporter [Atopobiaceae bacterium]|nr:MFS transporter [Atopobiaceae bacterium]
MDSKSTKSNFGKWGWSTIIYCAISYYIAAALATDTLSWYPAAFAQLRGWGDDLPNLANAMTGIAGWISVLAAFVFSVLAAKKGSRWMAVLGNVICGVGTLVFAHTQSLPVFLAMIVVLVVVGGTIQVNIVPNNLMNIWFPKKKGLALGWASMGLPLCTATIILFLNGIGNPQTGYTIIGIACFVLAALSIVWVKNEPEEVGATPDNEPVDLEAAEAMRIAAEEEAKKMTLGVIAKNPNTWFIGFGHGLLWMTTIGLVSNMVTRFIQLGIEPNLAILMMTVAAVFGIVGSYIWGWIDQKFGTKNASLIYGCWYIVSLLLMIFNNGSLPMTVLCAFFVGFGIGGIGNLIPSMIGTCFGRFGFIQANRLIAPVNTLIRCTGLIIIGVVGVTNLTLSYWIFMAGTVLAIVLISRIKEPERA